MGVIALALFRQLSGPKPAAGVVGDRAYLPRPALIDAYHLP